MNVKVGALAEIATIDANGKIILDTKGAVILNCGKFSVKDLEIEGKNKKAVDSTGVKNLANEIPNVVNVENEVKKEQEPEQEPNTRDDGANDMII